MYKYKSCAKLNSYLNITSKLSNGYHELSTHFQLIDLFDDIEFSKNTVLTFSSNTELDPKNNSIIKAIDWFNRKFNKRGVFKVSLNKNIPIGAGLGGGSSNCASTLKFLCDFYSVDLNTLDMDEVCFDLGADVPIFLYGKSTYAAGCGQIFTKDYSHNSKYILIAPNLSISTKELFQSNHLYIGPQVDEAKNNFFEALINESEEFNAFTNFFKKNIPNSMQNKLRLTGTGSTLFIENPLQAEIELIMGKIENNFRVFRVKGLEYYH